MPSQKDNIMFCDANSINKEPSDNTRHGLIAPGSHFKSWTDIATGRVYSSYAPSMLFDFPNEYQFFVLFPEVPYLTFQVFSPSCFVALQLTLS